MARSSARRRGRRTEELQAIEPLDERIGLGELGEGIASQRCYLFVCGEQLFG